MNCYLTTRFGQDIQNPSEREIDAALAELDIEDDEHPDVSLRNEEEWCLATFPSGKLIMENLEEGDPMHMKGVSRDQVKKYWSLLAAGDLITLQKEPWAPGYGNE